MSLWTVAHAWTELLYLDLVGLRGFSAIQRAVHRISPAKHEPAADVPALIAAFETACTLYPKTTLCLQRSAVVTRLLRRHGVAADMMIGCVTGPLRAHAWVEVNGSVVSDDVENLDSFHIMDRW